MRFLLNRVIRIVPLYWMLTLLAFGVAMILPGLMGGTRADGDALARSLAFMPYERADGLMRPLLFVGWSLNLEMGFYVLFALTLPVRGVGRRVALATCLIVATVISGYLLHAHLAPELRFFSQPMVLDFAAGMVIGWLHPAIPVMRKAARVSAGIGVLGIGALVFVAQWRVAGGFPAALLPACLVVLAALVAERGGLTMSWQPVAILGGASYALYLTHPFVTQGAVLAARHAGLLTPTMAPLLMVIVIIGACACAIAVHHHVERPLGDWLVRTLAMGRFSRPMQPDVAR